MYYVYALSSKIKLYIYVGLTSNLLRRINQYNSGKEKNTRPFKPFVLIYQKEFDTRPDARKMKNILREDRGKNF